MLVSCKRIVFSHLEEMAPRGTRKVDAQARGTVGKIPGRFGGSPAPEWDSTL